ncbi:family 20 glycosylhydrolase [Carboxylicivirga marina]|uniref:beta-N-acetylhexosaminidase n=1 Tax=Carboxylicivirga marina TaxID=2800988 RepID=A0ABS1HMX1_9BACT|nr:family 20 glycosylhydrolase [Carboxylicivirga marina]MBK3519033.1 family 20 glycosylhydrolase [Carboxylicivirga marina]
MSDSLFLNSSTPFQFLTIIFILSLWSCVDKSEKKEELYIIPQPNEIIYNNGDFEINNNTKIYYNGIDKRTLKTIKYFSELVYQLAGFKLAQTDELPSDNYIAFQLSADKTINQEGYRINANTNSVEIIAENSTGLFYAIQSIYQIFTIHNNQEGGLSIPSVQIHDFPKFEYRGLNIDVARHFFPVEFIKKQLDLMALYKLNVFHWHLTDDQGWRIEIKQYPRLTSVGSVRAKTLIGHAANIPLKYDNTPYGGYYTQEEIKEIVAYAIERHITIIPEIEMPGHALAALAAYPELACHEEAYEVTTRWGSFDNTICPGKESSYTILKNILTEVASLFPGEYIHIGGDECSMSNWRTCEYCQKKIKAQDLTDENQLEHYFIRRIQAVIEGLGKKMAGWGEIMSDETLDNATIVMWRDDKRMKSAIKNGNYIIKSPNEHLYFDHYQSDPQNHPLAIGGYTPLKDVYSYNPLPHELNAKEQQSVIGTQANCWTEYMPNEDQVEYMLYPRLCAFSEISWTETKHKDWPLFRQKLEQHFKLLDTHDVNYFKEVPKPVVAKENINFISSTKLEFVSISDNYETRYTTDGSEPHEHSTLYRKALPITSSGTIKAITVDKTTGNVSKTIIITLNHLKLQKSSKLVSNRHGLSCNLYKGRFKTVKEILNASCIRQGVAHDMFIPDTTPREGFGLVLNGYFYAPENGIYQFNMNSDDGSALYVGDKLVVNNDGIHGKKSEEGAIALKEGYHPFKLLYFQATGFQHFNLQLTNPDGGSYKLTPDHFFY